MKFRILGPLEVTSGGRACRLGGPKPRAILAALLLQHGAVVSTDALIHAAWGEDAPRDAAGALQAYLSRLRSVIDPDGNGLLVHQAPGYVLDVPEDDLDATAFTAAVARGLRLAQEAHRESALEVLGAALDLWRGEPLAEFDPAYVDPDGWLSMLHEQRLVALEERAQLMVRLGRGPEVTAELETLVLRHPERERLAVVLMEALYAGGRQADALAAYRRLRTHLVDDLGVEPSESARSAHVRILTQDPTLGASRALPPANLPLPRTGLVGRVAEVSHVASAVAPGSLVTVTGVGGVGKSRLALEVAQRGRPRFSDGSWWVELSPVRPGGRVSQTVATALGVQQHQGSTMEETLVDYLGDRNALVVLDNCEHVLPEVVPLVDRLLSHCPGLAILTTSRESLAADGEQLCRLQPLPVEEASTLFRERANATGSAVRPHDGSDGEDGADGAGDGADLVGEICRRVDRLPLAVELAAARTRVMSVAEVLRHLDDEGLLVRRSFTRAVRQRSLTDTIDWSYRLLTPPEQRLFTRLSVFAGSARLEAVHAVCGEDGSTQTATLDLLAALADKSMVVVVSGSRETRYRVLETLRVFGRARLEDEEVTTRRHTAYFTRFAERAAAGAQGPDEARWIERILPDVANLRTAFDHAFAAREVDATLRLCSSLPDVLNLRVGYEAAGWAERALEIAPVDHPLFVSTVGAAARGSWALGNFEHALAIADRAQGGIPPRGAARIGYPGDVLADTALYAGDVETALRHYDEAVEAARVADDAIRLVWSLYYVAICHAVRRQPALGRPAAEESVEVAEGTENPTARSMGRYALGLVLKKEDPERALVLFDEAAGLAGAVQNFWWQGIALMEAAATRAVHAAPAAAGRAHLGVVEHWQRLGDTNQQWMNLRYVVRLLLRVGACEEAVTLHHYLAVHGRRSTLDPEGADRLRRELGEAADDAALARAAEMTVTQAAAFATAALRAVVATH